MNTKGQAEPVSTVQNGKGRWWWVGARGPGFPHQQPSTNCQVLPLQQPQTQTPENNIGQQQQGGGRARCGRQAKGKKKAWECKRKITVEVKGVEGKEWMGGGGEGKSHLQPRGKKWVEFGW